MYLDINKVKIVTAVPSSSTEKVRNAMCEAGAGIIGNYTYCSNLVKSLGTFIPNENANPTIGEKNKMEFVEEDKLEVVCNIKDVKNVVKVLRKAHPYEEPAIEVIPLLDINKI